MRNFAIACLMMTLIFSSSASAADKVIVVPLDSSSAAGCPAGLTDCSGVCVDTLNNPAYCGDCAVQCSAGNFCSNGICVRKTGDSCSTNSECISGNCVENVCCDTACSALCESCLAAKTGGVDGNCKPVTPLTDPDDECAGTTNSCDGGGSCYDSCNDFMLNGDETDVDCGGSCETGCASGQSCNVNDDCASGLCVDNKCS